MQKKKLLIMVLVAMIFISTVGVILADYTKGASVPDQPDHTDLVTMPSMEFTQSSSAVSYYLSDYYGDYATLIGGAYMQSSLTINDNGLPSWITYTLYSNRYDIRFTITPGADCDEDFWVLFSCFDMDILIVFPVTVIDDGTGVISDDDQYCYILTFDTQGGSSVSPMISYTTSTTHTFDISEVSSEMSGYSLKGWSTVADSDTVNVADSWILTASSSNMTESYTLYAVWEESSIVFPNLWSDLSEVLSDPTVLILILITFLAACLFVRSRLKEAR